MKYIIGIDPSIRENGIGLCVINLETNHIQFFKFKKFINVLNFISESTYDIDDTLYVIEDSNMLNVTFARSTQPNVVSKISRSVGKNQAVSMILIDWIVSKKYTCKCLSPKNKGSKWTKEYMMAIIKTENFNLDESKKISQDEIDAFTLAYICKPQKK
jgi:methyl coenzyme M reductase beta subunit